MRPNGEASCRKARSSGAIAVPLNPVMKACAAMSAAYPAVPSRASTHPSILLDETGSARGFERFTQLIRIALHAERANLGGIKDAPFALILAANQRLPAAQRRIFRLHGVKRRLCLSLASLGGKLHHEAACLGGVWADSFRHSRCRGRSCGRPRPGV